MRKQAITQLITTIKPFLYPLFITLLEITILSGCAWFITNIIPHMFIWLKGYSFVSWMVLIAVYKIITYKYVDEDENNTSIENTTNEVSIPLPFETQDRSVLYQEPPTLPGPTNVAIYPFNNDGKPENKEEMTRE